MVKERMSIHKALAEIKILNERIMDAIDTGVYCAANKHSNDKIVGFTIEEYKKKIQGSYDKVIDLISRNNAIKKAVSLSNASTKIVVNEKEYTVAEAIWMKQHGIENKEYFLSTLKDALNQVQSVVNEQNSTDLEKRAENYVIGLYGGKEGKVSTETFEKVKADFINSNKYDVIDPIIISDKIESLEDEISKFRAEIDSKLSESNALTMIDIEY